MRGFKLKESTFASLFSLLCVFHAADSTSSGRPFHGKTSEEAKMAAEKVMRGQVDNQTFEMFKRRRLNRMENSPLRSPNLGKSARAKNVSLSRQSREVFSFG
jgi:hypothetical protein